MWVTIPLPLACRASALPFELISIFDLNTGNDPISLVYKTSASPLMLIENFEIPVGFEPTYHSFADWDL